MTRTITLLGPAHHSDQTRLRQFWQLKLRSGACPGGLLMWRGPWQWWQQGWGGRGWDDWWQAWWQQPAAACPAPRRRAVAACPTPAAACPARLPHHGPVAVARPKRRPPTATPSGHEPADALEVVPTTNVKLPGWFMGTHELGDLTLKLMAQKLGRTFLADVADGLGGKDHVLLKLRGGSTVGKSVTGAKTLRKTRLTTNKLHIWGSSEQLVRRCFNAVQLTITEYHSGVWGAGEEDAAEEEEKEEEEAPEGGLLPSDAVIDEPRPPPQPPDRNEEQDPFDEEEADWGGTEPAAACPATVAACPTTTAAPDDAAAACPATSAAESPATTTKTTKTEPGAADVAEAGPMAAESPTTPVAACPTLAEKPVAACPTPAEEPVAACPTPAEEPVAACPTPAEEPVAACPTPTEEPVAACPTPAEEGPTAETEKAAEAPADEAQAPVVPEPAPVVEAEAPVVGTEAPREEDAPAAETTTAPTAEVPTRAAPAAPAPRLAPVPLMTVSPTPAATGETHPVAACPTGSVAACPTDSAAACPTVAAGPTTVAACPTSSVAACPTSSVAACPTEGRLVLVDRVAARLVGHGVPTRSAMCFAKYIEKSGRSLDELFNLSEARPLALTVGQWGPQRLQGVTYQAFKFPFRPGAMRPRHTRSGDVSVGFHGTTVEGCWRIMADGCFRTRAWDAGGAGHHGIYCLACLLSQDWLVHQKLITAMTGAKNYAGVIFELGLQGTHDTVVAGGIEAESLVCTEGMVLHNTAKGAHSRTCAHPSTVEITAAILTPMLEGSIDVAASLLGFNTPVPPPSAAACPAKHPAFAAPTSSADPWTSWVAPAAACPAPPVAACPTPAAAPCPAVPAWVPPPSAGGGPLGTNSLAMASTSLGWPCQIPRGGLPRTWRDEWPRTWNCYQACTSYPTQSSSLDRTSPTTCGGPCPASTTTATTATGSCGGVPRETCGGVPRETCGGVPGGVPRDTCGGLPRTTLQRRACANLDVWRTDNARHWHAPPALPHCCGLAGHGTQHMGRRGGCGDCAAWTHGAAIARGRGERLE